MDFMDVITALHLQETALKNAVRDPVLMHLGSLEKSNRVLRQRDILDCKSGGRGAQVRPERRRRVDVIGKIQHGNENDRGKQEKKKEEPVGRVRRIVIE